MRRVRSVTVSAFAKLNLGLEVLGRREDGYHELRTLFQTIDLADEIRVTLRGRGTVKLSCDRAELPTDARNLAVRAALELQKFANAGDGIEIVLRKRIPVAGGLGGGSSDAAAVLLALDQLWNLGLGTAGLHPLARRLGADVPFFLVGGTALGLARGDEIYPLWHQIEAHVVLVDPGRPVSTAAVFARLDASLTPRENGNTIYRFVSRDLDGSGDFVPLSNELEAAALEEAPDLADRIQRIRSILVAGGAQLASLSGSGSSYFGLFDAPTKARRARQALSQAGFQVFGARTLSLERYRRAWSKSLGRSGRGRTSR